MKHILIAGSARSGKSTLASMIKDRFPYYNLFHGDCIRSWLIALYGKTRANEIVHSEQYPEAMTLLANTIMKDSKHFYIIEWSRFFPMNVEKLSERDKCHVIYLGHGGINAEVLMKRCRKYDDEGSFTMALSDEELLESCSRWASTDLRIMDECEERGIKYYNTSFDRMSVLQTITMNITE